MDVATEGSSLKGVPPKAPALGRPVARVQPKVEIVIACEGRNTEPRYFRNCVEFYGAGLVRLRLLNDSGVPMTLVQLAIQEKQKLVEQRRRSRSSFDSCFRVWAVFDRDEHPHVDEALALARANGIDVAFSNPCFELWPLLHLGDYGSQDGRAQLQATLQNSMPKYDHAQGATIDFDQIRDEFNAAFKRAAGLVEAREAEGCPLGAPSTTVGNLVLKIVQNGKRGAPTR